MSYGTWCHKTMNHFENMRIRQNFTRLFQNRWQDPLPLILTVVHRSRLSFQTLRGRRRNYHTTEKHCKKCIQVTYCLLSSGRPGFQRPGCQCWYSGWQVLDLVVDLVVNCQPDFWPVYLLCEIKRYNLLGLVYYTENPLMKSLVNVISCIMWSHFNVPFAKDY